MNFIKNATAPTAKTPRKQIFTESQSSLLPGFFASRNSLEDDLRNDFSPKVARSLNN
jgi:hypothetical protein